MDDANGRFAGEYLTALEGYLSRAEEAALHQAYEFGRRAVAEGFGVLDMTKLHEAALLKFLLPEPPTAPFDPLVLKAAGVFFTETLSHFEATHRGFRETIHNLSDLNVTLAHRNIALADTNRNLQTEIAQRKRTEKALRQSKEHYRELFDEARVMQENLRSLSNQILHAQEEERKRISREMHDEVGQSLTAVNLNLTALRNETRSGKFSKKVAESQKILTQTMETVHRFARALRPAMLDDLGLVPALRSYAKAFAKRTGLRVYFSTGSGVEKLGPEEKTVLYRVAQESLTNVAKHAEASQVRVRLRNFKQGIRMDITDNGKSFRVMDQPSAKGKKRLGLLGIQERVRLVNGQLKIDSAEGKGTTIRVRVPFKPANLHAYEKNHRAAG